MRHYELGLGNTILPRCDTVP